jgi:predicted NUDIX family NTP pyrophosphohydrolase
VPMPRLSAGLLMYRFRDGQLQVFLAHPGGPFYAPVDDGYPAWRWRQLTCIIGRG